MIPRATGTFSGHQEDRFILSSQKELTLRLGTTFQQPIHLRETGSFPDCVLLFIEEMKENREWIWGRHFIQYPSPSGRQDGGSLSTSRLKLLAPALVFLMTKENTEGMHQPEVKEAECRCLRSSLRRPGPIDTQILAMALVRKTMPCNRKLTQ